MYTHTQSKAYGSHYTAIAAQCTNTGMPGTTQTIEPCAVNPPGARLVACRRTVPVSQIEVAKPTAPQQPHTTKRDQDS